MTSPSQRIFTEWRNRVEAEYRSASLFAQLLHWLIQLGFPDDLVRRCHKLVDDELEHAKLSHECLIALGASPEPMVLDASTLALPLSAEGMSTSAFDLIVRHFCIGETLAVPLFAAMRQDCTNPTVSAALDTILADEAQHRSFGWDALDELLRRDPVGATKRFQMMFPQWIESYRQSYCQPDEPFEFSKEEGESGMIPRAKYREVFDTTLQSDIHRRIAKRSLDQAVAK